MAFIEKSTAGTFVDVDKSGGAPSVGDVFVFQSDLFDPATNAKVGTVEGHCTVITASLSDCDASGILVDGQIRVGGATTNANVNVLAVTGGTGVYRNVSGQNTTETIDAQRTRTPSSSQECGAKPRFTVASWVGRPVG